jgi:hypothetical protein
MEDKIKLYTFGIQDKKGKWHYLTTRYKLYPLQLREAHYQDKINAEESAKFILEHLDSNEFDFETAHLFELTIKAIPFNCNKITNRRDDDVI